MPLAAHVGISFNQLLAKFPSEHDAKELERQLLMLLSYQGVRKDQKGLLFRGLPKWKTTYNQEIDHKNKLLKELVAFPPAQDVAWAIYVPILVNITSPRVTTAITVSSFLKQKPIRIEKSSEKISKKISTTLKNLEEISLGKLYRDIGRDIPLTKEKFEILITQLLACGTLSIDLRSFYRQEVRIDYLVARFRGENNHYRSIES